jgi:hypothetical protein
LERFNSEFWFIKSFGKGGGRKKSREISKWLQQLVASWKSEASKQIEKVKKSSSIHFKSLLKIFSSELLRKVTQTAESSQKFHQNLSKQIDPYRLLP